MPKAIRVEGSQQMANYRRPASFLVKETYPLPPYSSVIGMVHVLCGWLGKNNYHPMKISIQGEFASTVSDYATNYVFGVAYDPERHQKKVPAGDGSFNGISITPKIYELLTDVKLVLHIVPDDESLLPQILEAMQNPPIYPSLGRYEDTLRISSVQEVDLVPADDAVNAKHDIYVPEEALHDSRSRRGTVYNIGKVFAIDERTKGKPMRYWKESKKVRHISKGSEVASEEMLIDTSFQDMVFLV